PALAFRHAAPWARKTSATSRGGRATRPWSAGRRFLRQADAQPVQRALDVADCIDGDTGVPGLLFLPNALKRRIRTTFAGRLQAGPTPPAPARAARARYSPSCPSRAAGSRRARRPSPEP